MTPLRQPHRADREETAPAPVEGLIETPDERAEADRLHDMLHDSLIDLGMSETDIAAIRATQAEAIGMRGTGDLPEHAGRDPWTGSWRNW